MTSEKVGIENLKDVYQRFDDFHLEVSCILKAQNWVLQQMPLEGGAILLVRLCDELEQLVSSTSVVIGGYYSASSEGTSDTVTGTRFRGRGTVAEGTSASSGGATDSHG